MFSIPIRASQFMDRKSLIIGDVSSGKSRLTASIVKTWIEKGLGSDITIVDLAPRYRGVGRGLDEYIEENYLDKVFKYLTDENISAPRLMSRSRDELMNLIKMNYLLALRLFEFYLDNPTGILVINDLSICLHYDVPTILRDMLSSADTFLANSYYGKGITSVFYKELDLIERRRVENLFKFVDILVKL